jgi:hypothetical protein
MSGTINPRGNYDPEAGPPRRSKSTRRTIPSRIRTSRRVRSARLKIPRS